VIQRLATAVHAATGLCNSQTASVAGGTYIYKGSGLFRASTGVARAAGQGTGP
jgi:hypothetical protein